ncbi:adenomatous polyposis coli protein [Nephila pilipes]|uniref:Adenomatous polyposis coli protein n=1 Tax=Nephila pilipes TaxID=299642 RepID=A0A8X6NR22_NEPPI|nr:adenomatous polyposis coli protein [Nephila pilipes]
MCKEAWWLVEQSTLRVFHRINGTSIMAEFIDGKEESVETKNSISPPQVAKRSNIRLGTNVSYIHDSIRGRGSSLTHAEYSHLHLSQRQQYLYNSPYHIPLIEESAPIPENTIYEADRPGTPALGDKGNLIVDDAPSRLYRNSLGDDDSTYEDSARYHRDNYTLDRHLSGGLPGDPNLVFPPTTAPPTSPSQLYALLLQRNIRPTEYPISEPRPRASVPNHLEWSSNIYQSRILQQNDYRRDLRDYRERERLSYGRIYNNTRPRYDHYSHVDRRPFLNQNYTRLPYNMVRIKNSNDDDKESNSMNGFTEDDEGNHECHDLRHSTAPGLDLPTASVDEFHQNGTLPMGAADGPEPNGMPSLGTIYQGEWPMHRALWMSGPSSIGEKDPLDGFGGDDTESIMSFSSSTATMSARRPHTHQLGTKVEMVYSLLSMLGSCNKEDMSRTLLEMSSNQDSCIAMRQSGCLPLLIQLLHGSEGDQLLSEQRSSENVKWAVREARRRASQALHNIVHAHPDDRRGRREARVLRLLEQIRDYSDFLRDLDSSNVDFSHNENLDLHPGPAIAALMKLSFDEEHRHAMCQLEVAETENVMRNHGDGHGRSTTPQENPYVSLISKGGLQAIAELIQADHEVHGNTSDQFCVTVRRYAGMALTNLTFGDGTNKALLCSMKPFMQALVAQLHSPNEDLRQVTASVLRNLSWRADASSKQILREVGVVTTLMKAAMEAMKESTLKSILSALWNLSAHCSMNKADICEVDGALEFLVSTLTYKSSSSTLSIIENGGGILRNISSHIAVQEEYRVILRKHKCLQTLLSHLKSPSLTIVSNACGTLWNLSARCPEDQQMLWEMGAVGMLRNLIHSKHKMISMGSSAALKNLLAAKPEGVGLGLGSHSENGHHLNGGLSNMPSLLVRKQRALAADLDENLAETCDNIDSPKTSPTPGGEFNKKFTYEMNGVDRKPQYLSYLPGRMYHSINGHVGSPVRVPRSESKDSLGSSRSEPPHYKAQRERFRIFVNNNRSIPMDCKIVQEKPAEWKEKTNLPFEGNSNVVLQMFRHLQSSNNSTLSADIQTNGHAELSSGEEKPAVRPNSLPPPRKGYIRNNRLSEKNLYHNGLHHSNGTNGFEATEMNGHNPEPIHSSHNQINDTDFNELLEIPGNKRTFPNSKQDFGLLSGKAQSDIWRINTVHNQQDGIRGIDQRDMFKNVVMRPKKTSDTLSSSATTLGKEVASDDQSVDQTPLVISRCSSLSSLTSCFQHSARSSWVSDVSQRTSAVISPSDLPDSPGYCTSEEKHRIFEFTDKIPEADAQSLIRPRPAWPMNSLPSNDSLPSSIKRMSLESDVFVNSNEAMHSETITDHSASLDILESPDSSKTPPSRPQNSPFSPDKDQFSSQEDSGSQENEQQNQDDEKDNYLVEACINLGMPGQKQEMNTTLHSKISNLLCSVTYSRSGIPIKSRLTQSFPAACKPETACANLASQNYFQSIPGTSQSSNLHSRMANSDGTICDDNDNLINSGNTSSSIPKYHRQREDCMFQNDSSESKKGISDAFLSKCLDVCKKYPALSQKSSFDQAELRTSGKTKTSIPQIVRTENTNFDTEQHPRQLHIKSQNLPVYRGFSSEIRSKQDSQIKRPQIQGNSSSTEENISEDNILSSSPSACDESEGPDSDYRSRTSNNKSGDSILRNNRVRSRKTKANRRSMEIRPPSEQSSEDDNKNVFSSRGVDIVSSQGPSHIISVPSSESEEKVKEDERTKEKVSRGVIPDLLEGAAYQDGLSQESEQRLQNSSSARTGIPRNMTDSMELRRGALMIAAELEEGIEDYTHSSTSFDLENMKPPSCLAEMSMTSSGLSDLLSNGNGCYINGKRAVDRRRNIKRSKKLNNNHRFVFKSVRQTIAKTLDVSRQIDKDKPVSASTSMENISMKSSGTSDLIENINPPSVLDDLSMTNSCASLNSISSDILESRSQSLADPRSNSEMFQRLNAAAAMVQVYSRELSNIMTGSMKSSCNSDCLDLVKPPSIFQDIAEVTMEDGTEILSDPLVSDFELEEELPHDDEPSVPSTETMHSPFIPSAKYLDEGTDNLNSSVDGDSLMDKEHFPNKQISSLAMEPRNNSPLNSIQNPSLITDDDMSSGFFSNLTNDDHCSIDRDDNFESNIPSSSPPAERRGPRIVKPINRETIRQMQEKKNVEKSVKSIRGKVSVSTPRNLLQQVTSARIMGVNKSGLAKTPSPSVSGVRPTRTSALRASQNKQTNLKVSGGRMSPRSFLSKPPASATRSFNKVSKQTSPPKTTSISNFDSKVSNSNVEVKRPHPPVKQNTFTKDETSPKVPLDTDMPSIHSKLHTDYHNNNNKISGEKVTSPLTTEAKVPDRKLSLSSTTSGLPSSNMSLQRKLSAPVQRKSEKSGISLSPSSQSIAKIPEKKSPSSGNLAGRGTSAVGSRTTSTNSLSSVSSNSLSIKKQNSQKDVPSKISSIWKRSESSSSANSPITDSSSAEKQLSLATRGKIVTQKNVALRCSSVTTPPIQQKTIPRSSTYEKISKTNSNLNDSAKSQNRATAQLSGTPKSKQPVNNVTRNIKKLPTAISKPSGGPRIVKPVTPRPKPHAITSKSLRQSGSFAPYSGSCGLSSGPPACITSGKSYGNFQDPKISIPLVTAPFAYMMEDASDSRRVDARKVDEETNPHWRNTDSSVDRKKSDSEESDREFDTK